MTQNNDERIDALVAQYRKVLPDQPDEVLRQLAVVSIQTGLNPALRELWAIPGEDGEPARVAVGYRGVVKLASVNVPDMSWRFEPLTSQERQEHEIAVEDLAIACVLDAPSKSVRIRTVGVVRASERFQMTTTRHMKDGRTIEVKLPESSWRKRKLYPTDADGNRLKNWDWADVVRKRAATKAMSWVPGYMTVEQILAEAQQQGLPVGADMTADKFMDEQAARDYVLSLVAARLASLVDAQPTVGEIVEEELTPAQIREKARQRQADFEASVAKMRGDPDFEGFD